MLSLARAQLLRLTRWGADLSCIVAYALCMALTVGVCLWNPEQYATALMNGGALSAEEVQLVAQGVAAGIVGVSNVAALGAVLGSNAALAWFTCLVVAYGAATDFQTGGIRTVTQLRGGRLSYVPARLLAALPAMAAFLVMSVVATPIICAGCGIALGGAPAVEALAWLAQLLLVTLAYVALTLLVVVATKSMVASLLGAVVLATGAAESLLAQLLQLAGVGGILPQLTLGAAQTIRTSSLAGLMEALVGGHDAGVIGFVVPLSVLALGAGAAVLLMRRRELGR